MHHFVIDGFIYITKTIINYMYTYTERQKKLITF